MLSLFHLILVGLATTAQGNMIIPPDPEEPPPPLLYCSENPTITLDQDAIEDLSVELGEHVIVWPIEKKVYSPDDVDEECVKIFDVDAPDHYIVFNLTLSSCYSEIEEDEYVINVTYTVRNLPTFDLSSPIQRYEDTCLLVTCTFNKKENVTQGVIEPSIRKTFLDDVDEETEFDIEMNFYETCDFEEELEPPVEVEVYDDVNVKVALAELDPDEPYEDEFILQMRYCYATLHEDDDKPKYVLIEDGCPSDDYIDVVRNFEPVYGGFKFASFVWTNYTEEEQEIYVHCEVCVCHNSTEDPCGMKPNCDARTRRDLIGYKPAENGKWITSPRIRVVQNEPETCDKDNGGCSDKCMMSGSDVVCGCFGGRTLRDDMKTCSNPTRPRFNLIEETKPVEVANNQSVMIFSLLGLIAVLTGYIVFSNLYKRAQIVKM